LAAASAASIGSYHLDGYDAFVPATVLRIHLPMASRLNWGLLGALGLCLEFWIIVTAVGTRML